MGNRYERLDAFERRVCNELQKQELSGAHILVGFSGGVDSFSLLEVLTRLSHVMKFKIGVATIDHSEIDSTQDEARLAYRRRAVQLGEDEALKRGLSFFTNRFFEAPTKASLSSIEPSDRAIRNPSDEAELRAFRYKMLLKFKEEGGFHFLALAHHQDDLLVTRLIRLIRGTGIEGLKSMAPFSSDRIRPFLHEGRSEIESYARRRALPWIEDPSNRSSDPLRNWIRDEWLPPLESKRTGAVQALSRSLELISHSFQPNKAPPLENHLRSDGSIDRTHFLSLCSEQKRQIIASYLHSKGAKNYSHGQIEEILKRLNSNQNHYTFRVAHQTWQVEPTSFWI